MTWTIVNDQSNDWEINNETYVVSDYVVEDYVQEDQNTWAIESDKDTTWL